MKKQFVWKPLRHCMLLMTWLLLGTTVSAQRHESRQQPKEPDWVTMMDDPNVNFFVIEKSFNDFWKGKELPIEEDEILDVKKNTERKRRFLGIFKRKESEAERDREEDARKYAFAYKKYQWWRRQVLPYVQPDGSILSSERQVQIWQQQKQLKTNIQEKHAKDKKEQEKNNDNSGKKL
ncbi:hypothetical protein HGH92_24875 [Chitinophaga varians]|uniref:Uncharacterized protein n=1 Tax=Chitinophaga varians TaxID=2202339 RepID=A0A847RX01_9BACT|nr:hypothetical protein [Chitinophaga varians]NLR67562.1 hypothetical protein [Chitinophaga varians]